MGIRFRAVMRDLASQGIAANDLTADELAMLVHACDRVDNPYTDLDARLCERPVEVCRGVYLWPLTAGAQVWLADFAETWWPRGSMMYTWATVYALHHAREPEAFACLADRASARRAIALTMLRFCCHPRELRVAMSRCYGVRPDDAPHPQKPKTRPDEQAVGFARFVAELEAGTGIKAEYWLWGKGLDDMLEAWNDMRTLSRAAFGRDAERHDAELDLALENLANAKAAIWKRLKGGKK